jgi:DNA-binding NtrC family response regulator
VFEDPSPLIGDLLRKAYRPFDGAADLVRCFAGVAMVAAQSPWAEVHLSSLQVGGEPRLALHVGAPRDFASRSQDFPMRYQRTTLGWLSVPPPVGGDGPPAVCRRIAETLAFHLKRQELGELAREEFGRDLSLIGTSAALSQVDRFIEHASRSILPALLLGEAGSEVEQIALALHLAGPDRREAFVQVNGATLEGAFFEEQWLRHLRGANRGTLVLAHLEGLALRSQHLLCQILEGGLAGWTARETGQPFAVRLLATGIRQLAASGQVCPELLAQLDVLHLEVEPLRERREDIAPLLEHHLRLHRPGPRPQVSAEVLEICSRYDWPGDVSELSRVAARLAVMTESGPIPLRHVRAYAPQILAAQVRSSPAAESAVVPPVASLAPLMLPPLSQHPALARAIHYINENFERKLPLAEVAASSYVSSSHLSHLFQQDLGTSFTRFLTGLRIERAKVLLRDTPRVAITMIAGNAGFADLRHFERIFKGAVGCTPKMFRWRSAGRRAAPQEKP